MNQIEFVRFLFTEDYQISKLLSRQRINNESGPVFILFNFHFVAIDTLLNSTEHICNYFNFFIL